MPLHRYDRGPWYRGGVPRSYVAPSIFASVGCGGCLGAFGIFFMISGGAMLGISSLAMKSRDEPPFDTPFFKEHRAKGPDIPGIVKTVGSVLLGIGCTMFFIAIIMCVVVAFLAKKQENKRHAAQQNPLTSPAPVPPPSAYPHQPPSQVYPPPGTYPAQPVSSSVPLQSQSQYPPQQPTSYYPSPPLSGAPPPDKQYPPPQPTSYYPPPSLSGAPPSDNQYPPPSYTPNAPPQTTADTYKQPLE